MPNKLDELDAAEKAMTPGPWHWLVECKESDTFALGLLRNHARTLIDVARAAARHHGSPHEFPPGHLDSCEICVALARLEALK